VRSEDLSKSIGVVGVNHNFRVQKLSIDFVFCGVQRLDLGRQIRGVDVVCIFLLLVFDCLFPRLFLLLLAVILGFKGSMHDINLTAALTTLVFSRF
jgi:hypothetical protein